MIKVKCISVLVVMLLSASSLLAGNIVYPWRATTAIVKTGESFEVWFNAERGQSINSVELESPYLTVSTSHSVASGTWEYDHESGNTYNRRITVTVPNDAPADRYDLILKTSSGDEISPAAVKVIKEYKDFYYVVQLSDAHRWQNVSQYPMNVTAAKVGAVIDAANIVGAEIIFECGDHLYNFQARPDLNAERVNIMFGGTMNWSGGNLHGVDPDTLGLNDASGAVFLVPGNHDAINAGPGYSADPSKAATLDWYNSWYGLAYFNFKYGNARYMGFNSGMGQIPAHQRNAAEAWLNSVGHSNLRVGIGHIGFSRGESFDDATNLNLLLVGHNHFRANENPHSVNGKPIQYVANSMRDTGTGNFEYNLFRVNNRTGTFQVLGSAQSRVRVIENHTTENINNPSSWIPMLELNYDNPNDGSSSTTTATFTNRHNFAIPDAHARFIMPKGAQYTISNGTITQAFDGDSVHVVDVSVDLAANSTTTVEIAGDGSIGPTIPNVSFDAPPVTIDEGEDLLLTVNALDPDGIDRVFLYMNGVALDRSEDTEPYQWGAPDQNDPELLDMQAGLYEFRAVARDMVGDEGEATLRLVVLPPEGLPTIKINFQPASAAVPSGYLADVSQLFGDRGNGYSYGWGSVFDATRERTTHTDPRLNTLNHTQRSGGNHFWEIELENGDYLVSLTGGDPDFDDTFLEFIAEEGTPNEVTLVSESLAGVNFASGTQIVTVSDGRLTITNGPNSDNNKISYVDIGIIGEITAPDPYEAWKATHNITDDFGDEDKDGIENLLEFALGGDPRSPRTATLPEIRINGDDLEITLLRQEETITYVIEKSTDLINWEEFETVTDAHGAVGEEATIPVPASEIESGRFFLRLRVER